MDEIKATTEQAISWFEKRLEQRPTPGERVMFSMALSALRTQQEKKPDGWISVKDMLPPLGERVLCSDGTAVFEQYRVEFSAVYGFWERSGMKSPMQNVTHWMPMPEPPEVF